MLKFLDKLDPQLSCKGYLLLKGADIMNLQSMIFTEMAREHAVDERPSSIATPLMKSRRHNDREEEMGPVGGGCFAPNMRTQKKAKRVKKKSKDDKTKKEKPKQPTL